MLVETPNNDGAPPYRCGKTKNVYGEPPYTCSQSSYKHGEMPYKHGETLLQLFRGACTAGETGARSWSLPGHDERASTLR